MKTTTIICILIALASSCFGLDLSGNYDVTGTNPDKKGKYAGKVTISKNGEVFLVHWKVGIDYIGTGILKDDTLSVAYKDANGTFFGIVAYKVLEDGKLMNGEWCTHGGKSTGTEVLKKQ